MMHVCKALGQYYGRSPCPDGLTLVKVNDVRTVVVLTATSRIPCTYMASPWPNLFNHCAREASKSNRLAMGASLPSRGTIMTSGLVLYIQI